MLRTISILSIFVILLFDSGLKAFKESYVFVSLLQQWKIVTFRRDLKSGELERCHVTDCPADPAFLAASGVGRILFVSLRSSGTAGRILDQFLKRTTESDKCCRCR